MPLTSPLMIIWSCGIDSNSLRTRTNRRMRSTATLSMPLPVTIENQQSCNTGPGAVSHAATTI